jgi:peptidoglycan/LPS O-acetylase OafA/YrhL
MGSAFTLVAAGHHRKDIDGLRAIAVAGAILFHFGVLPRGYLGVDVFFVISGFLITGIIYRESKAKTYSLAAFYVRRIRRILPLTLCVSLASLVVGMLVMLPDDLENLSQSVIATNLCANNVLQAVTTRNYWDVVNEYKPLMHTWSLAVEEQYYLIYPFLFLPLQGRRVRYALPLIGALAAFSLALCALEPMGYRRFYFLQYRFFELAVGGIVAILLDGRTVRHPYSALPLTMTMALIVLPWTGVPSSGLLVGQVLATCGVLASANTLDRFTAAILENRVCNYVGRISFSLYMWHQVVLAFARYAVWESLGPSQSVVLLAVIVCLSMVTYHVVEQPFRDTRAMSLQTVLASLLLVSGVTMGAAGYVYARGGVIRDVPELGISSSDAVRNMHGVYNDRVFQHDLGFKGEGGRIKVLVVGDSFARDWANVVLESRFGEVVEVSYVYHTQLTRDDDQSTAATIRERAKTADVVFVSRGTPELLADWGLAGRNVWVVGPKNFGQNNGIYYNARHRSPGVARSRVPEDVLRENETLRRSFAPRFIDLISPLSDVSGSVPVFTPEGRFISQDTRHLTRDGARYYAKVLDSVLKAVFEDSSADRPGSPIGAGGRK